MDVVRNGLMSGADLVQVFSGRTKNKVFFFVRSQKGINTNCLMYTYYYMSWILYMFHNNNNLFLTTSFECS